MTFLSALLGAFLGAFAAVEFIQWRASQLAKRRLAELAKSLADDAMTGFDRLAADLMKDESQDRRH